MLRTAVAVFAFFTGSFGVRAQTAALPQLVKDIAAGSVSSDPGQLNAFGNTLYFFASDANGEPGLWKVPAGTTGAQLVKSGIGGYGMGELGSGIVFQSFGSAGSELWVSDGTAAGTKKLTPSNGGSGFRARSPFTLFGGKSYFRGIDFAHGDELWVTDGTDVGTALLKDINPGTASSDLEPMAVLNGRFYFTAFTPATGTELWSTDGTAAGTSLLRDISPPGISALAKEPRLMSIYNNLLYFSADDSTHGREMWLTDGTAAGTVRVTDAAPGTLSHNPSHATVMGGKMYYVGAHPQTGNELWGSDGTAAGTGIVLNAFPGQSGAIPNSLNSLLPVNLALYKNRVYYAAENGTDGLELWSSDGTAAGTAMLVDAAPGGGIGIFPRNLCISNGYLYFTGTDPNVGVQLWRTDGTVTGTTMTSHPGMPTGNEFDPFVELVDAGNKLYFPAEYDAVVGRELYSFQEGPATVPGLGSVKYAVIYPNPATGKFFIRSAFPFSGVCSLRDLAGRLIRTVPVQGAISVIDVAGIPCGTYSATVTDQEGATIIITQVSIAD